MTNNKKMCQTCWLSLTNINRFGSLLMSFFMFQTEVKSQNSEKTISSLNLIQPRSGNLILPMCQF